jgi:hypothetical protein
MEELHGNVPCVCEIQFIIAIPPEITMYRRCMRIFPHALRSWESRSMAVNQDVK